MSYNYCNNCGLNGHTFNKCKYPITSLGIICCKLSKQNVKFLLIRRKDTLGYVEFIRGKYPINNKIYIQNIIDEMTTEEKRKILSYTFDELWRDLWSGIPGVQYRSDENVASNKFEILKSGVNYNGEIATLETFVSQSKTSWIEPEWGFPKGRRNFKEKDMICALREFQEETGYNNEMISIIQNVQPLEEIFTGSNYKSYKHNYYIAIMKNNYNPVVKYQKSEVSAIRWLSFDEACSKLRPYNLERIKLLSRVNTLLREYRVYG
jgi:8-oxo-dGTP pyrophosphatase MutT (NUDIX family)